jgi:hypothetical protein
MSCTPPVEIFVHFFTTLIIHLILKIMQVPFTLLATYFIIVGILSLTYPFYTFTIIF